MLHPCTIIYNLSPKPVYGNVEGTCRITGKKSIGLDFQKWVRDTFTDIGFLYPGNIISNEAAFCFEEQSEYLRQLTGKDKLQRFRNYSHIVVENKWYVKNKGEKEDILKLMLQGPELCVIAESGQKHIMLKAVPGTWQLEETIIQPNIPEFQIIHQAVTALSCDFSNNEISAGNYLQYRIIKFGMDNWRAQEDVLRQYRGSAMFDLALFFSKIKIENYG